MSIRYLKHLGLLILMTTLISCSATHTIIAKRKLTTQTKMSHSLFLEPVGPALKTVYLQIRNNSDKPDMDLTDALQSQLTAKGYRVVIDPTQAHFLLQANILSVARTSPRDTDLALESGYGAALGGAAVGAAVGSLGHHHHDHILIGTLAGAALSSAADAMVDDITYSAIMDVQISERQKGHKTRERVKQKLTAGSGGATELVSTAEIPWRRYQTRISSSANQVNLKYEEASPSLKEGLARSLAGIF